MPQLNKYNFAFVSSTNIDRIFSIYHAAKDVGLSFVCDDYQAEIMETVSRNHKQYSSFYNIDYTKEVNSNGRFFNLSQKKINSWFSNDKLKKYLEKHGFCMLIRQNNIYTPILDEYVVKGNGKIYYSMWSGYLDKDKSAFSNSLYDFFEPYEIKYMHTNGHVDVKALKEVFDLVNPNVGIIPIHTEYPEKFKELFTDYKIFELKDGRELDLYPISR